MGFNGNKIYGLAIGITAVLIGIIIMLNFSAEAIPEIGDAGDDMNDTVTCTNAGGVYNTSNTPDCHEAANNSIAVAYSSVPLNSMFGSNGTISLLIVAALLVLIFVMVKRRGNI